jgi:hypothetical protein
MGLRPVVIVGIAAIILFKIIAVGRYKRCVSFFLQGIGRFGISIINYTDGLLPYSGKGLSFKHEVSITGISPASATFFICWVMLFIN